MVQKQKIPNTFAPSSETLLKRVASLEEGEFLEVKSSDILARLRYCLLSEEMQENKDAYEKEARELIARLYERIFQLNTLQIFIKEGIVDGAVSTDADTPLYAYVTGLTQKGREFWNRTR